MGYLINNLRKALGGTTTNSNWTPNDVRTLVISRYFILVAHHTRPVKVINLDINEVQMELSKSMSQGALHNLLKQRQLSCMEEIYVDGMFQNYRHIMNVEGYVQSINSGALRLRYYGYIDADMSALQYLSKVYGGMQLEKDYKYTIAKDTNRPFKVMYNTVNEGDWYKKYNLRPKYYKLDSEKGTLAQYFRKCESSMGSEVESYKESVKMGALQDIVNTICSVDKNNEMSVLCALRLKKFVSERKAYDNLYVIVESAIVSAIKEVYAKPVVGLKEEYIEDKNLSSYYKLLKRFDNDGELTAEYIEQQQFMIKGFLKACEFLDSICYHIIAKGDKAVVMNMQLNCIMNKSKLPVGRFSTKIGVQGTDYTEADGYVGILCGLLGIKKNSLLG